MSPPLTVLVVDDNRSAADAMGLVLARHGHRVDVVHGGAAALARLDRGGVDVVLTDLRMDEVDGLEVLRHARALALPPEVLVLTGYGTVDDAVRAMRLGARDFLTKPVSPSQVLERLARLRGDGLQVRVQDGASPAAARLRAQIDAMAGTDAPVLLLGEPGSGRDQVARALHESSPRARAPFVVVAHPGRALEALPRDAGAVFLPNVDLLDPRDQVTLVQRLDDPGPAPRPRLLASAAPGWDLAVTQGGDAAARELYYRLAVLELRVPALRERAEDVEGLLVAWVRRRAERAGVEVPVPSPAQREALRAHAWPGNLRELAAVAERAVVLGPEAFSLQPRPSTPLAPGLPELVDGFELSRYMEQIERAILEHAIEQTGGDRAAMSRILGVERNALRYKLNKHGLLERT